MKSNNISLKKFGNTSMTTISTTNIITSIPITTSITNDNDDDNNDNAIYAIKYNQQACLWSDYVENIDWAKKLTGSSWNLQDCINECMSTNNCTGFEVSTDMVENESYCALWYNGACSVPTYSYVEPEIDTYTLINTPIEAFTEYNNMACSWFSFTEGIDWEIAHWSFLNASDCASICVDTSKCTGFELAEPGQWDSPYENGYCALWYNGACSTSDGLRQSESASTYLLVGNGGITTTTDYYFYYGVLSIIILACCISCCGRCLYYRKLTKLHQARVKAAAAVLNSNRIEKEEEEDIAMAIVNDEDRDQEQDFDLKIIKKEGNGLV